MRIVVITCLLPLLSVAISYAQTVPVCPADVMLDLARAASTCYGLGREDVCGGNGSVTATSFGGGIVIDQPGDRVTAGEVRQLSVVSTPDELGIASLSLRGDLPSLTERSVSVLALGAVTLVNHIEPLPQLTAIATGLANIRSRPQTEAEIIGQAAVNNGLILNGRTADGRWLRAQVRNRDAYGWVSAEVLNVQGNVNALVAADEHALVQRPFQSFDLTIENTVFCDGALPGGVLMQAPGTDAPVTFVINASQLTLTGTAFVRAGGAVYALQGYAILDELFVPAGAWALPGQGAEPFDPAELIALPLHLLPVSVRLPAAITEGDIARLESEYRAAQAAEAATPAPPPTADPTICRRTTRRAATLYAGPGDFYEAINELRAGQSVTPTLQTADPDGRTWWQLRSSNWILAADVREAGECQPVPRAQVVPAPHENRLSLETCETTNGPLRAGQRVTIEFTPPPWNNWGEAHDAVIVDPGHISIGARTFRTQATDPIQIGTVGVDDRYLRRFYITWAAELGTYRIVGDRLSYEPICTLTVPVE